LPVTVTGNAFASCSPVKDGASINRRNLTDGARRQIRGFRRSAAMEPATKHDASSEKTAALAHQQLPNKTT
jgi:hypothetical protein